MDSSAFATVGPGSATLWSIRQSASRGTTDLSSRPVPIDAPSLAGSAGGLSRDVNLGDCPGGVADAAWVAAAWGAGGALYLLSEQGLLCSCSTVGEGGAPGRSADLHRRAHTLVWAERLCGERPGPQGLLACALADGTVEVLDAELLRPVAMLATVAEEQMPEVVGLSYSVGGESLWVLYADRSLARWRGLDGATE